MKTIYRDHQMIVSGPDAVDQSITVHGRIWRFDFDDRGGPLWLRKDGTPRHCQNPNKAVWDTWQVWFDRWEANRKRRARAKARTTKRNAS